MKALKCSNNFNVLTFWKDQRGTATVEFVICVPVFVMLLGLVVDTSLVFAGEAQALRVVQDANRSFSIGRIKTISETQTMIVDGLKSMSPGVTAVTVVNAGVITSTATMPAQELSSFGILNVYGSTKVKVTAQHMSEI